MKRLIFIFRITHCYPLTVPTLIKYSHSILTFKPYLNFQQQIFQHNEYFIFALIILLIVSLCSVGLTRVHAPARHSFGILNLTQAVRTDLYAKMEMLA